MFRKILVCVDIYPLSIGLLSYAADLKRSGADEVVLVHIMVC